MTTRKSASRQLIDAIESSGMSRYRIGKLTGISQATLSRMIHGKTGGWIGREAFDKLGEVLGLTITSEPKPPPKGK